MLKTWNRNAQMWSRCKAGATATIFVSAVANCVVLPLAHGNELVSTDDLKVRWDNTLKYTDAWRVAAPNGEIANQNGNWPNTDFGDLGYGKGDMVNDRFDLLSEFDITYKNFGGRVSGAYWYDAVYAKGTNGFPGSDPLPNTQQALAGGANNALPKASSNLMGNHGELDDAFVFGKFDLGEQKLTVRLGKHTLIYGESLFLGQNGIAVAQGPVDVSKALSLPNSQFKEIAMPVDQISASLAVTESVSLGAYYQFAWKPDRFPGVGSYFSPADVVGAGANLALLAAPVPGGWAPVFRGNDFGGKNTGQWGMQAKFSLGDVEYGLYAAKYDDKAPIMTIDASSLAPGLTPTYNLMYATNISVYGASFSTVVSGTNLAGEISTRRNIPLVAPGDAFIALIDTGGMNNVNDTPYARGNSLHMNLSTITVFPATSIWDAGSLVAEYAFNRLLDVTHDTALVIPPLNLSNTTAINPAHTRDADFVRAVFTAEYFQVTPGVDISVPIGVGYGLSGRSVVAQLMPYHGGDFSLGLNATMNHVWKASLNYTNYFGNPGSANGPDGALPGTFKNSFADRDFVSVSIQRTF